MVRHHQSLPQTENYGRDSWTETRHSHLPFATSTPVQDNRAFSVQNVDTYSRIECFLRDLGISDFALITVLESDGRIEKWSSPSLRDIEEEVFNHQADLHIQHACGRKQSKPPGSATQGFIRNDGTFLPGNDSVDIISYARRQSSSTDSSAGPPGRRRLNRIENSDEDDPNMTGKRKRTGNQNYALQFPSLIENTIRQPSVRTMKPLTIGNESEVRAFYIQRFRDLQQSACKVIAKAFVKLIEPKKQTNYPYTKGYDGAPKWWPLPSDRNSKDGVPHREPDHLLKPARVQLLVHILCLVVNPSADKPDTMRKITVKSLEEVTTESMNTWYAEKDHPDNQKKRPFIVEIFKVAKQHERYMKGEVDKTAMVHVMHGSDTTGVEIADDEVDEGLKYDGEDENNHEATPTSSIGASPAEALVSPMNGSQGILNDPRSDPNFYQTLPVRAGYHQPEEHPQYEHYRQPSALYTSQSPVYGQQTEISRRGSTYSIPANAGYQSPAPSGIFGVSSHQPVHWQQPPQSMIAAEHYTHQQPQTYQLPPPQQLVQNTQQQMNVGFPNHSYQPPQPQQVLRTCNLSGPPAHTYATYLGDGQYAQPEHGDMKHEGL